MDGAVYLDMQGGTTNGDYKSIPGDVNLYNNNGSGDAITQEPSAMGAPGQGPAGPGLPKGSPHSFTSLFVAYPTYVPYSPLFNTLSECILP